MIPFPAKSLILAPMAGITDSGFRKICKKYGADVTVSEMVSSKGIYYNDKKSVELMKFSDQECPVIIQIFGHDTECMRYSAEYITKYIKPLAIDINMGCPAPKIFCNGDGSALMKNIEVASDVIKSVKQNTDLPVSVKFRSGVDENHINAIEFAKMCEQSGADYITVHPRTREQFYSGNADINIIKNVADSVSIPIIANGDITDGKSAADTLENTGAHSIMIGRGTFGNPAVFSEIKKYLGIPCPDAPSDIFEVALEQLSFVLETKPEQIAVKEFRKHLVWYFKGMHNAAKYKRQACDVQTYNDVKKLFEKVKTEI